MGWVEKISTELVIITGDEKRYRPNWVNAVKEIEYNISEFTFPNVSGSLVKKNLPRGARYAIEIFFQGDDNLEIAESFRESSEDPRHWHILHPYYGNIRVQPSRLKFDNTKHNVTKITGTLISTIPGIFPRGEIIPQDLIDENKAATDTTIADAYAVNNPSPSGTDINQMNLVVDALGVSTNAIISDDDDSANFNNSLRAAKAAITDATSEPLNAIRETQNVINFPILIGQSIKLRVDTLISQFNTLIDQVINVGTSVIPRSSKVYFETVASTMMGAISTAVSTSEDPDDFGNRKDVDNIVEQILAVYNLYIDTLDDLQTETATDTDSFVPDSDSVTEVNALVNFTLSNLFDISLEARQERVIILEQDSNLILLTHRFYGLDEEDENINEFIRNNNIGIIEHLSIKKGREITYFV